MLKRIYIISAVLLLSAFILVSRPAGAQNQPRPKGLPKGAEPVYPSEDKDACEMKTLENACYCKPCQAILVGYSCRECKAGKHAECAEPKDAPPPDETAYKKPAYLFTESEAPGGKICPCCGKDKLGLVDLVDKKDSNKCRLCGTKNAEEIKVCARTTYHCPVHQNLITLKIQKCQVSAKGKGTCNTPFVIRSVDRQLLKNIFICPKCFVEARAENAPPEVEQKILATCQHCKVRTAQKKRCAKSAQFPHVKGNLATQEVEK